MSLDEIKAFIEYIVFKPWFAGLVGAIVSILWHKPIFSTMAMHIIIGTVGAMYVTQPLIEWQGISITLEPFVALMIGLFGGSLCGAVLNMIHTGVLSDLIKEFLRHKLGVKNVRHGGEHE